MMNQHLMLDLETLGTGQDTVVLSIGAVLFNRESVISEAEWFLDLTEQIGRRKVTASTIVWWLNQPHVKEIMTKSHREGLFMEVALEKLSMLMGPNWRDVRVWSNGANFDIPIIEHMSAQTGRPLPWQYWNTRCYRTLKSMFHIEMHFTNTGKHNALEDAKFQAKCLQHYLRENPRADT